MYIFNNKKESGLIVDGINAFKNAKKDFSKLRELFNYNWEEQNIIEEYTNIIKNMNENELEKELYILKEYFGLKYMNQSDILNLKKDLILFINKKEEIFKDLNHSFNFIMQLAPKNYEISNIFNNLKDNISKNINLNLIKNYDNLFENFIKNISKKKLNEKTVGIAPKYNYENYENNNKLMNELISEREKNKSLIKKIETLKYKINENNPNQNNNNRVNSSQILVINPGEKIMSFIIMSIDQKINRCYPCKNTDTFVDYEKKLYEEYPEYKEEEYYFTCNGEKIKRFKTIEENKIKDGDKIFMIKYEND